MPTSLDKGKGRAQPPVSERTPLLEGSQANVSPRPRASRSSSRVRLAERQAQAALERRRSLRAKLLTTFLVTLSIFLILILLVFLLIYSYGVTAIHTKPQRLISHAVYARGPHAINVLNATAEGVWVQLDADIGIDADWAMGLRLSDEDVGFLERAWRELGRWGVRKIGSIVVDFRDSVISLSPEWTSSSDTLLMVSIPPLVLPLTAGAPLDRTTRDDDPDDKMDTNENPDLSWLSPISIKALVAPSNDTDRIRDFLERTWRSSRLSVRTIVPEVEVRGGSLDRVSWRDVISMTKVNAEAYLRFQLPTIPGLPQPGTPLPKLSNLVTLLSYSLKSQSSALKIEATATAPNPIPPSITHMHVPPLPFEISLIGPDNSTATIAAVTSQPQFKHPNITLPIHGSIIPIASSASTILSAFVTNYLSARDSPISIKSPLFPNLKFDTAFPAPEKRPRVLRDVRIKNMKLSGYSEGSMLASGIIFARIALPPTMQIDIHVHRVLPDVLIFNGDPPGETPGDQVRSSSLWPVPHHLPGSHSDGDDGKPPRPPLPDPLPDRAFARVRPDDWLLAEAVDDEPEDEPGSGDEETGTTTTVRAVIENVPLEILPGREAIFRNFLSKVVFAKAGALAGIQGTAAVGVEIPGLIDPKNVDGELDLIGLPFSGQVRIGRRNVIDPNIV